MSIFRSSSLGSSPGTSAWSTSSNRGRSVAFEQIKATPKKEQLVECFDMRQM